MAIIGMQRRLREVARLRIGEKKTNAQGKTFPGKLGTFRITSRDRSLIDAAARLYGGDVKPWSAPDGSEQWDIVTKAAVIEVVVPPADMAFSQFYEQWSGGGCLRRCDGARELISEQACLCDPDTRDCTPHTRLSLILPDMPVVGLFRLDTSGFNAAEELAGAVDLARAFAAAGQWLPAELRLELREKRKPGEQTKKFAVPCLDLKIPMRALAALSAAPPAALDSPGHFTPVPVAELPAGPSASISDQVSSVGKGARPARANAAAKLPPTGRKPRPAGEVKVPAAGSQQAGAGGDDANGSGAGTRPARVVPSPAGEEGGSLDASGDTVPSSPESLDPHGQKRAQTVAMWCRDYGIATDDDRHRFLEAFSRGAYSSSKDVGPDELPALRAALVRFKRGEVVPREQHDGTWWLAETSPLSDVVGGGPGEGEASGPPPAATDAQPWTKHRWLGAIEHVAGVGETKLLNQARKIAHELGVAQPETLDDVVDDHLVVQLLGWLKEKAG